ncbi:MAG: PH domain-containing protein [Gemmatales bacterium]|nr:PH domain-containing protein [Gemmatales bacterium]MDW7994523.1 PH domain-containing protein [Gemmatales bacterium]
MSESTSSPARTHEAKSIYLSPHEVILGASIRPELPSDTQQAPSTSAAPPIGKIRYDTRHLLPSFVLGLALSLGAVVLVIWLNGRLPRGLVPPTLTLFWASGAALWAFLLFRWAYRGLLWRVEITEQEIIYRRGWLWPRCNVTLARLARVEVRQPWWQRLFGLGEVALIPEEPGAEATVLVGIAEPHALAEQISFRIRHARERQVQAQGLTLSETKP